MRTLMIGNGYMGKVYLPLLLERSENVLVVDRQGGRLPPVEGNISVSTADLQEAIRENPDVAFVLTNTPSHANVVEQLVKGGIKHIFVEKPLAMTSMEAEHIRAQAAQNGVTICVAYLTNFSPAVKELLGLMESQKLMLAECRGIWWKNRTFDTRPTPGNEFDEMTHQVCLFLHLIGFNQNISDLDLISKISYLPYADTFAQEEAHRLDVSFPEHPSSSCSFSLSARTDAISRVMGSFQSSFVSLAQQREVSFCLMRSDSNRLWLLGRMQFDTQEGDKLEMRFAGSKTAPLVSSVFSGKNKVSKEVDAFLALARGEKKDPRLTGIDSACMLVSLTEQAIEKAK